jgi:hypothetical protein
MDIGVSDLDSARFLGREYRVDALSRMEVVEVGPLDLER